MKVFFASGDDKGVREQVHCFLTSNAVSFEGEAADFRRDCLDELKRLRKSGLLSTAAGSSADIARQAAGFKRHADPQGLIEESRRAVAGVADALADGYPNLARLLRAPTPAGPPLLAAAFCYFFRREVETDDELAHGLFFDGLRQLSASQARAFGEVGKALAALGGQFDAVFEQLDRVEAAVVETKPSRSRRTGRCWTCRPSCSGWAACTWPTPARSALCWSRCCYTSAMSAWRGARCVRGIAVPSAARTSGGR